MEDSVRRARGIALVRASEILRKIAFAVSYGLVSVAAITLAVMTLFFAAAIIMRYFFNDPIYGDLEAVTFMLAVILPFSFAYCAAKRGHVEVTVLVALLGSRPRAILKSFSNLLTLGFVLIVLYAAVAQALVLMKDRTASIMFKVPTYLFGLVIALGAAAFVLVMVAQVLDVLSIRRQGEK
jgi:TRAP-type C4-dicarboxylate transport system permease small subunit